MEKKEQHFERYLKQGNCYEPIGETRDILPSGFYHPVYDDYHDRYILSSKEVIMPNLYVLPNDIQNTILEDIQAFWKSEERYRKFGNVYKRNILLYSLPGNGKTSLINIIAKKLIDEHDGVVITIDSRKDLISYRPVMERFRSVEPNRKVVTIIEDFERLANNDEFTALLLQTLDGNGQFDNVVTIATTNYPEILEKRFTCRPSRFNLVIEYKKPNAEIRKAYIEMKLADSGIDINDEKIKNDIERYVNKSEGYTFDFVKELVQGIYVDGISEVAVFDRLESLIDKDGKIKITEDEKKKIGFSYDDNKTVYGECCADSPRLDPVQETTTKNVKVVKGFG